MAASSDVKMDDAAKGDDSVRIKQKAKFVFGKGKVAGYKTVTKDKPPKDSKPKDEQMPKGSDTATAKQNRKDKGTEKLKERESVGTREILVQCANHSWNRSAHMRWQCMQCSGTNGEHAEYCGGCGSHWSNWATPMSWHQQRQPRKASRPPPTWNAKGKGKTKKGKGKGKSRSPSATSNKQRSEKEPENPAFPKPPQSNASHRARSPTATYQSQHGNTGCDSPVTTTSWEDVTSAAKEDFKSDLQQKPVKPDMTPVKETTLQTDKTKLLEAIKQTYGKSTAESITAILAQDEDEKPVPSQVHKAGRQLAKAQRNATKARDALHALDESWTAFADQH